MANRHIRLFRRSVEVQTLIQDISANRMSAVWISGAYTNTSKCSTYMIPNAHQFATELVEIETL